MRRCSAGRSVVLAALSLAALLVAAAAASAAVPREASLVRLAIETGITELGVPVLADVVDASGREYALALLGPSEMAGHPQAEVIDSSVTHAGWWLALERRPGARRLAASRFQILLDDGRHIVLRAVPGLEGPLAELGFDLVLLDGTPMSLKAARPAALPDAVVYDARVAAMLSEVQQTDLWDLLGGISGEAAVTIGGSPYTIATRNTGSGTPIQKATQYAFEQLEALGLDVEYHNWSSGGYSGRNVIATKRGATDPDEIVIVIAHLDDMPSSGPAPGADDNGSGSAAVLQAADVMASRWFQRTVRFVLVTGEEQGLLGSGRYATKVENDGDNVVAVYNMDMIAWDDLGGPVLRLHTRTTGNPGYAADLAIATTFSDAVGVYGLSGDLSPVIDPDGITASDHASFWNHGYAAILAIEDDQDDFNDYYHTSNDLRQHLDPAYFTAYTKASIATVAHLALPTNAPCQLGCLPLDASIDGFSATGTISNVNGVFEPGETAQLVPTWKYPAGCLPSQMTASLSDLGADAGLGAFLVDGEASYGVPAMQEVVNCRDKTGNCYLLKLANPVNRPALHIDAHVRETTVHGVETTWTMHVGASFSDVPPSFWAYQFIERMLHNGITAGCSSTSYCPEATVSRWQMAVFLAKTLAGGPIPTTGTVPGMGDFDCSLGGHSVFADVPPEDGGCPAIHFLATQAITVGCGGGNYCPAAPVDRWQMAVFLAKGLAGGSPIPTTGTVPGLGDFDCSVGGVSVFTDVPPDDGGCPYIHDIARRGVTVGCGGGAYCPTNPLSRDQMAVFLGKAFDLGLN